MTPERRRVVSFGPGARSEELTQPMAIRPLDQRAVYPQTNVNTHANVRPSVQGCFGSMSNTGTS